MVRPETELLLKALQMDHHDASLEEIRALESRGIDWVYLVTLAYKQKVAPFLYDTIKKAGLTTTPETLLKELSLFCFNLTTRNTYLLTILTSITDLFDANGITSLPFKGPILGESLYGNYSLRVFSDLDILVSPEDAFKARSLLIKQGYTPELELNQEQLRQYLRHEFDFKFYAENGAVVIELHWDMAANYLNRPLGIDDVLPHTVPYTINSTSVLNLSNEMLLVFLCVHACKHKWESMEQVTCIAEVMKRTQEWEQVVTIAGILHCRTMVLTGLKLAEMLLNAPLPEERCRQLVPTGPNIPLITEICESFFKTTQTRTIHWNDRFSFFHLKIRDRFSDKINYAIYLLFNPSRKEWHQFRLPAGMTFLLRFLRPLRLVWETIKNNIR